MPATMTTPPPEFYAAIVEEMVVTRRRYLIRANSIEEARDKAERGETEYEADIKTLGVVNRAVTRVVHVNAEHEEEEVVT